MKTMQPTPRFLQIGDIIINTNSIRHIDLKAVRHIRDENDHSSKWTAVEGIAIYTGEIEENNSTWSAFIPSTEKEATKAFLSWLMQYNTTQQ